MQPTMQPLKGTNGYSRASSSLAATWDYTELARRGLLLCPIRIGKRLAPSDTRWKLGVESLFLRRQLAITPREYLRIDEGGLRVLADSVSLERRSMLDLR